jgi:hypothetical protein
MVKMEDVLSFPHAKSSLKLLFELMRCWSVEGEILMCNEVCRICNKPVVLGEHGLPKLHLN